MYLLIVLNVGTLITTLEGTLTDVSGDSDMNSKIPTYEYDIRGYLFFCLCIGSFEYQMEYFLGGLAFAKGINRTLVLPPFRSGYNRDVPFTDWIKKEPLEKYHRVMTSEDFMTHIKPPYWPLAKTSTSRLGYCYQNYASPPNCNVKSRSSIQLVTSPLSVENVDDVDENIPYQEAVSLGQYSLWNDLYPEWEYPFIAMNGAPALSPMREEHRYLQKYIVLNESIEWQAQNYINQHFKDENYVGIHLRNGEDWVDSCQQFDGMSLSRFAPLCIKIEAQCLPNLWDIIAKTEEAIAKVGATAVFIVTDKDPMVEKLQAALKVKVYHMDPRLPLVDIAILKKSTWFIGNCVSALSGYVKRHRDAMNKNTSFFGM